MRQGSSPHLCMQWIEQYQETCGTTWCSRDTNLGASQHNRLLPLIPCSGHHDNPTVSAAFFHPPATPALRP